MGHSVFGFGPRKVPVAPTAVPGTSTAQVATTEFVEMQLSAHDAVADPYPQYQKESEKGVASGYASLDGLILVPAAQLGDTISPPGAADNTLFLRRDKVWIAPSAGAPGSANGGQATIPFASYLTEDVIAVTGQASLLAASAITCAVYADNDDVLAQDWWPPVIKSVVAGAGFTVSLRPRVGTFKGNVKLNWNWV